MIELARFMTTLSNSKPSPGSAPVPDGALYQIDWHDARSEYDRSVVDLLATIRRCSTWEVSDEVKLRLLAGARNREQAAFFRYKRVLDVG